MPNELYELVKLRALILNGCSFCTDMHSHAAPICTPTTRWRWACPSRSSLLWLPITIRRCLPMPSALSGG
ncbi:UNVERIFIED_CONTAM: carboxymuconolactone decarboxylase family protein [Actinomycetes bacterium ARC8]|nr:carboxymuconolactone decarboxylase family protein [Actinomycetes bacterium ARC8]